MGQISVPHPFTHLTLGLLPSRNTHEVPISPVPFQMRLIQDLILTPKDSPELRGARSTKLSLRQRPLRFSNRSLLLLFEVTCGPIVFFLMINRVIWMERRQMGKQRGGREVVLRRV